MVITMQQWTEIPRDWIWIGDPGRINEEVRAQMGRRQLNQERVADIIGIKRQALARRLKNATDRNRTPWRRSELIKLARAWDIPLLALTSTDENPKNYTDDPEAS